MLEGWYKRYLRDVLPRRDAGTEPLVDFTAWLRDQAVTGLPEDEWLVFLVDQGLTFDAAVHFLESVVAQ